MNKSDWAALAFYVFLFGFAFISFASQDIDTLIVLAIMTMTVAAVSATRTVLRARQRDSDWDDVEESRSRQDHAHRQLGPADDMDVHRVLDIDQRLEALERAETRRLREQANDGVISAPASPMEDTANIPVARQRV